ncbi:fluoride efflux transporter FluC [Kineococcus indalonis]|uniref:fluoride efflux transporter FluC n=1 Tax=Kineococcus indalonis TaxID=2696566 RepID=UPI0014121510|nr:CrcB family protein [Kineococcus indalonis]NAZ88329.1 chromosome condensation protein CrcB [Kineococcus indalonis]
MRTGPERSRAAARAVVAVGAVAGACARHGAGQWLSTPPRGWPVATTAVNLLGCLALGVLLEGLARCGPDTGRRRLVRLGAGTGLIGSFTTCSTLAVETDLLARDGRVALAVAYPLVSVVAGVVLCGLGVALAARLVRPGTPGGAGEGGT